MALHMISNIPFNVLRCISPEFYYMPVNELFVLQIMASSNKSSPRGVIFIGTHHIYV